MPHGFDHVVHVVRDLNAVADVYVRAGFTVTNRNQHPWGTHNRIVQLKGAYIELLEVAEPEKIVAHGTRSFSFGAFNRDFIAHREGFSMLLLNSRDAVADTRAFESAGISHFDVFEFAREGKKPDGTTVKLAFSLAFARDDASPELGFGACQHHYPENFWNPAFQNHANGAQRLEGVVMVASEPARHLDFLKAYVGSGEVTSNATGVTARTENGTIEVLGREAARDRGILGEGGEGMTFRALRIGVADLAETKALHRRNKIASSRHGETLIVPPNEAFGATLIFEASKVG